MHKYRVESEAWMPPNFSGKGKLEIKFSHGFDLILWVMCRPAYKKLVRTQTKGHLLQNSSDLA